MFSRQNGFTIVELLTGGSILLILFFVTIPANIHSMDKSKEVQAKENLYTIRMAVERYNTDNHHFPPFLLGGDREGWETWHELNNQPNADPGLPANNWLFDPLIAYNYMTSYPENPFIYTESKNVVIRPTCFTGTDDYGLGDPRFGYTGQVMGMCLDDPYFFGDADPVLPYDNRIETKRTLDRGKYDPTQYGYPGRNSGRGNFPGLYYNFGGRYDPKTGKTTITFWPGSFFYRGTNSIGLSTDSEDAALPYPNMWGKNRPNRYLLGVWGFQRNEGKDVIRLQEVTPDENQERVYWRFPPPWSGKKDYPCGYTGRIGEPFGLPEVFGGGDQYNGPSWPYGSVPLSNETGNFAYGSPDGVRDGIFFTSVSGSVGDAIWWY